MHGHIENNIFPLVNRYKTRSKDGIVKLASLRTMLC